VQRIVWRESGGMNIRRGVDRIGAFLGPKPAQNTDGNKLEQRKLNNTCFDLCFDLRFSCDILKFK